MSSVQTYGITQPGAMGVNTQRSSQDIPSSFCLRADNFIFDSEGQLAPRKKARRKTNQPTDTTDIGHLCAYSGTTTSAAQIFACVNNKIYGAANPNSAFADRTAGTAWTGNDWQSCTLNNKVHFFQRGQTPKVYNFATGLLADCGGTPPLAHVACTAFGRLWAADVSSTSKTILYWSVIADGEAWAAAGSGSMDLKKTFNTGDERIVAIQPFNKLLVVFGHNSILLFGNPTTPLAYNNDGTASISTSLTLEDTIDGIGAVSRDMVVNTGEDIVFLSKTGLRSLGRVIQERSNPITTLSRFVEDEVQAVAVQAEGYYRSNYEMGYKLCWFPSKSWVVLTSDASEVTYVFDMKRKLEGGAVACTKWTGIYIKCMCAYETGNLDTHHLMVAATTEVSEGLMGMTDSLYVTASDEEPAIDYRFDTTWLHMDAPGVNKVGKRAIVGAYGDAKPYTVSCYYDYNTTEAGSSSAVTAAGSGISTQSVPLYGAGSLLQLRIVGALTLQRVGIHFQVGRAHIGV